MSHSKACSKYDKKFAVLSREKTHLTRSSRALTTAAVTLEHHLVNGIMLKTHCVYEALFFRIINEEKKSYIDENGVEMQFQETALIIIVFLRSLGPISLVKLYLQTKRTLEQRH